MGRSCDSAGRVGRLHEAATVSDETEAAIGMTREHMNRLRGRLFGALEAVGMPDKQETAAKSLVRQITYDLQADIESVLRGTDHDEH